MKKCNVQKDINIYFNQLYYIMNNLYINIILNKLFLFFKNNYRNHKTNYFN